MAEIQISAKAENDLKKIRKWYEIQEPGLGEKFINHVELTLQNISDFPEIGKIYFKSIRKLIIRKFPFIFYYRYEKTTIRIIACYHSKRDPDFIENELNGLQ